MNKAMQTNATGIGTATIIALAQRYAGEAGMRSSAELCLHDALALLGKGQEEHARNRAIDSLAYSVGIFGDLRALAGAL